jgi:predicted AlkP superfamily phosphohydrolase/phosphomutase
MTNYFTERQCRLVQGILQKNAIKKNHTTSFDEYFNTRTDQYFYVCRCYTTSKEWKIIWFMEQNFFRVTHLCYFGQRD